MAYVMGIPVPDVKRDENRWAVVLYSRAGGDQIGAALFIGTRDEAETYAQSQRTDDADAMVISAAIYEATA